MFGRIFWIIVVLSMFCLGVYLCNKLYKDWQENPVITTITTTAYSVKRVLDRDKTKSRERERESEKERDMVRSLPL